MPSSYIVFHMPSGTWNRSIHHADSPEEAMIADIRSTFPWLDGESISVIFYNQSGIFKGEFEVRYEGEDRPIHGGFQKKGDHWFHGRIHIGEEDDCLTCAGTGVAPRNHPFQCIKCGQPGKMGKGTGKIKNFHPARAEGTITND